MKVIQVFKPIQYDKTPQDQLELVDGDKIPYWTVNSEMLKVNETYQQWLKRKEEDISIRPRFKEKGVEGIYLYDMQPVGPLIDGQDKNGEMIISKTKYSMMIRYDYIYKNNLNKDE